MALNIGAPFKRGGAFPIDETLVLTKAEMLAINDNTMPDKYFCICSDDGKLYMYDKTATPSAETGKYKLYGGGGGGTDDYEALINKPKINGYEVSGEKVSADYKLQGMMAAITSPDIDEIIYG